MGVMNFLTGACVCARMPRSMSASLCSPPSQHTTHIHRVRQALLLSISLDQPHSNASTPCPACPALFPFTCVTGAWEGLGGTRRPLAVTAAWFSNACSSAPVAVSIRREAAAARDWESAATRRVLSSCRPCGQDSKGRGQKGVQKGVFRRMFRRVSEGVQTGVQKGLGGGSEGCSEWVGLPVRPSGGISFPCPRVLKTRCVGVRERERVRVFYLMSHLLHAHECRQLPPRVQPQPPVAQQIV